MRGFIIIVPFMIFKPFKLPIPLDVGICLAGAVDLAWFIAFRASRGAATASEKFACIFRRPYDARFARLVAPLVWGARPVAPVVWGV